jgi:hypothetical protein
MKTWSVNSKMPRTNAPRMRSLATPAPRLLLCLLGLTVTLAGTSGCAFSRGDLGVPLREADIATIRKGQTTQADAVRLLGAPDTVIQIGNREAFHYYHYTLKHATVLVFSRVNVAADELYVIFDQHGLVDDVLFSNRTDKLRFQFWPFGN